MLAPSGLSLQVSVLSGSNNSHHVGVSQLQDLSEIGNESQAQHNQSYWR